MSECLDGSALRIIGQKQLQSKPDGHICIPALWEAEDGGSQVQSQPGQLSGSPAS